MEKKKYKLKSIKPKVFKFEKGEMWDGDEMIIHYIEDILLDDNSKIKQKTYITIHCVKAVDKKLKSESIFPPKPKGMGTQNAKII